MAFMGTVRVETLGDVQTNYGTLSPNTDIGGQTVAELQAAGYSTADINTILASDMGGGVTLGDLVAAGYTGDQIASALSAGLDPGDLLTVAQGAPTGSAAAKQFLQQSNLIGGVPNWAVIGIGAALLIAVSYSGGGYKVTRRK